VSHFPDKKIHITNELIHNPEVNDKLHDMNVQFIEKIGEGKKNFATVQDGDVVILPAFGASFEEMEYLDKKVQ
jgi:4-hydroxy-3-methylbut-2-enyl diphosphate reductase